MRESSMRAWEMRAWGAWAKRSMHALGDGHGWTTRMVPLLLVLVLSPQATHVEEEEEVLDAGAGAVGAPAAAAAETCPVVPHEDTAALLNLPRNMVESKVSSRLASLLMSHGEVKPHSAAANVSAASGARAGGVCGLWKGGGRKVKLFCGSKQLPVTISLSPFSSYMYFRLTSPLPLVHMHENLQEVQTDSSGSTHLWSSSLDRWLCNPSKTASGRRMSRLMGEVGRNSWPTDRFYELQTSFGRGRMGSH